ncbi:hypothetical protein D9M68_754650 [compost metagenome]
MVWHSASLKRVFCICSRLWPNTFRSATNRSVSSMARSMQASDMAAVITRSRDSSFISWRKPCPSSGPSRFSHGTRMSSKNSSAVSCECRPTFASVRPRRKPFTLSVSTTMIEMPRAPCAGSVFATRQIRFAVLPLVM